MPRVVLVPGFAQTAASWAAVLGALDAAAPGVEARAVDIPEAATFAATARALGDAGGTAVWVGYSLGGRLALRLALDRPDRVEALVLVSASPGLAGAAERAERVRADEALAAEVERDGVAAFLERWESGPLFAGVPADAPGRAERRRLPVAALAAGLRRLGTGAMEPLWDRLRELSMPVVLVTGHDDPKFDRIADEMAARIRAPTERVRLPGGHALAQERPDELAAVLARVVARGG